jgi:hypothetical protein
MKVADNPDFIFYLGIILEAYEIEPQEMSVPWFKTPLPSGAYPDCKYEVCSEITYNITHK